MKTSKIDRDFRRFKNFISEGFPEKLKNEITENKKIKNTFDTYLSYLDNISSNDLYKLEILYFDYLCSISNLPIELLFIEYPLDLPYRYKNYLKNRGIDPNDENTKIAIQFGYESIPQSLVMGFTMHTTWKGDGLLKMLNIYM
ncbi:MAG: hypothetical protein CBD21_02565 [bacterium TMED161]|nr:MAG: hypothetical protein CBD21_02565 [bacterium TMED161]